MAGRTNFITAVGTVAEYYRGENRWAEIIAQRTWSCRGNWQQFEDLVLALLREEQATEKIPAPLLALMKDQPKGD